MSTPMPVMESDYSARGFAISCARCGAIAAFPDDHERMTVVDRLSCWGWKSVPQRGVCCRECATFYRVAKSSSAPLSTPERWADYISDIAVQLVLTYLVVRVLMAVIAYCLAGAP